MATVVSNKWRGQSLDDLFTSVEYLIWGGRPFPVGAGSYHHGHLILLALNQLHFPRIDDTIVLHTALVSDSHLISNCCNITVATNGILR